MEQKLIEEKLIV